MVGPRVQNWAPVDLVLGKVPNGDSMWVQNMLRTGNVSIFLLLGASFHLSALAQRPQNDGTESKSSRFEKALAPIKLRLSVSALAFPQGLREQRRQFLS